MIQVLQSNQKDKLIQTVVGAWLSTVKHVKTQCPLLGGTVPSIMAVGQLNNRSRIPSFQVTEKQNGKIGIVWDFPQPQTQVYSRCIKILFQNQHFFVLLPPLLRGISQSSVQAQKWQMEIVLISPLVFSGRTSRILKKITLWPLFMDWVELSQDYRAITKIQFAFYQ